MLNAAEAEQEKQLSEALIQKLKQAIIPAFGTSLTDGYVDACVLCKSRITSCFFSSTAKASINSLIFVLLSSGLGQGPLSELFLDCQLNGVD